jgi:hypothetical protein
MQILEALGTIDARGWVPVKPPIFVLQAISEQYDFFAVADDDISHSTTAFPFS